MKKVSPDAVKSGTKVDHKNWHNDCKVSFNWVTVAL